jgi:3D (Asp-Asp-Asp) domain-containing protein
MRWSVSLFSAVLLAAAAFFLGGGFGWGLALWLLPERASEQLEAIREQRVARVTAYCPCVKCCGRWSDGHTASGRLVTHNDGRIVAARALPFGTRVIIPGYGEAEVQDRGPLSDRQLDVMFPTHQEALEWGVQNLDVEIISVVR